MSHIRICPDCESNSEFSRRDFLKSAGVAGAAAMAVGAAPLVARAVDIPAGSSPETVTKLLYESLTPKQKEVIAFDWNYMDPKRGLLRTRIANNWQITEPNITGDFYSKDQHPSKEDGGALAEESDINFR